MIQITDYKFVFYVDIPYIEYLLFYNTMYVYHFGGEFVYVRQQQSECERIHTKNQTNIN